MPLREQDRREFCAAMARARRLLLSDEPIEREERDALAGVLEHFEANFLAMDTATATLHAIMNRATPPR